MGLIGKRAPPYPHSIATSDIYSNYSPYITSKVGYEYNFKKRPDANTDLNKFYSYFAGHSFAQKCSVKLSYEPKS
jgi:hypothetical protein